MNSSTSLSFAYIINRIHDREPRYRIESCLEGQLRPSVRPLGNPGNNLILAKGVTRPWLVWRILLKVYRFHTDCMHNCIYKKRICGFYEEPAFAYFEPFFHRLIFRIMRNEVGTGGGGWDSGRRGQRRNLLVQRDPHETTTRRPHNHRANGHPRDCHLGQGTCCYYVACTRGHRLTRKKKKKT